VGELLEEAGLLLVHVGSINIPLTRVAPDLLPEGKEVRIMMPDPVN
jgi:hypothetical protein